MTQSQSAIAVTGLRKSFGDHLVLDSVDLDVADATIFALLGPNGAGKTTIVTPNLDRRMVTLAGSSTRPAARQSPER